MHIIAPWAIDAGRSASSKRRFGPFPPSSNVSGVNLSAAMRIIRCAVAGPAGEGDLVHAAVGTGPRRRGVAGDDVEDTIGNAGLFRQFVQRSPTRASSRRA